jgi:hypothetical protein
MCRVADDKELKKHYVFAKASLEHPEVKDWVKAEGIRGIPHLSIYDGTGGRGKCDGLTIIKCTYLKMCATQHLTIYWQR